MSRKSLPRRSVEPGCVDLSTVASELFWCAKLGVSRQRLRELVGQVGPRVKAIEAALKTPRTRRKVKTLIFEHTAAHFGASGRKPRRRR